MNELSLFTGAGGGVLGSKILGWRTIGYVEYEKYCQEIIKQRIDDGILDAAPIFCNISNFLNAGYAHAYSGMVDIVTAGFPCQPFSVAGKGLGEADPRNMWPQTIECIRIIRPRYIFLENVPGLLTDKYMGRIFGNLVESGYSFRWTCLGADDIGANHRRKRLWILAYSIGNRGAERSFVGCGKSQEGIDPQTQWKQKSNSSDIGQGSKNPMSNWWDIEPNVGRVANGVAKRVDRLKAIGNGQVPLAMARAFQILSEGVIN